MADDAPEKLGRRGFLKGAALGGVAAAAAPLTARAQVTNPDPAKAAPQTTTQAATQKPDPALPRPTRPVSTAGETTARPEGKTYATCGGDYIVDVLRSLDIEYFAAVPGNTFMGVHEAVINYGMLTAPKLDFITCMHEEASVAMCHGYAKIEGKPMACMMHTAVGIQHASMAIYNAYADRAPIFMMVGASIDAAARGAGEVGWEHAAQDGPSLVRDFTKWDDTPGSLRAFGDSAVRAYKFAMTPPYGPVMIAVDTLIGEDPYPGGRKPQIPKLPKSAMPAGEPGAVRDTAKLLVEAERPVLFTDRCARTPEGLKLLVELAETLQAPVIDTGERMNFPWRHPLNQTTRQAQLVAQADVLLMLEPTNPFTVTSRTDRTGQAASKMAAGSKRINISSLELFMRSNYQDFNRYPQDIDLSIDADAQATLPLLIEEVKRQMPASRKAANDARGAVHAKAHLDAMARFRQQATFGWDDRPITVPRLCAELYEQIRNEDWSLVSDSTFQSFWPQALWSADKHYQYIGGQGAAGIGYMSPAGLGAALANKKHGRLSVNIVGDGDLMFGPGILWTAAHERIPCLYIVHNNRAYHQEIMQLQAIANRRQRGIDRVKIGCAITDPNINYAMMAKSLGVYSEGPIENPADLGPALKRAIAVVKKGEPALIDVVSQGR